MFEKPKHRRDAAPARHFMVTWGIGDNFGGMTTMCLRRASLFRQASLGASVVTFDARPDYSDRRGRLIERGLLHPDVEILNLYDFYAEHSPARADRPEAGTQDIPLVSPADSTVRRKDGMLYRRSWLDPGGAHLADEFYRRDESLFLRVVRGSELRRGGLRPLATLHDRDGTVYQQYEHVHDLYRAWLDALTRPQPSVVVVDSKYSAGFIADWDQGSSLKCYVFHNNHVRGGGDRFTGSIAPVRRPVINTVAKWDAVVFLTQRQLDDFGLRFGRTSNLYTVSNPVERVPALPTVASRVTGRGVMLARLEGAKQLDQAVEVIRLAREGGSPVSLDIYGTGSQEEPLRELVHDKGLGDHIRFRGYVESASAELETANFCLLTSRYEGQPLVVMESMGRGCPVISYDIRYGPSDLLTHGRSGYLVEAGDIAGAASYVETLVKDSQNLSAMSVQAWEDSAAFSGVAVVDRWTGLFTEARNARPRRVRISSFDATLESFSYQPPGDVQIQFGVEMKPEGSGVDESAPTFAIRLVPRDTRVPYDCAVNTTVGDGKWCITGAVPAERWTQMTSGAEIDVSILTEWENSAVIRRIAAGEAGSWFPYSTVHGNLSLKPAVPASPNKEGT